MRNTRFFFKMACFKCYPIFLLFTQYIPTCKCFSNSTYFIYNRYQGNCWAEVNGNKQCLTILTLTWVRLISHCTDQNQLYPMKFLNYVVSINIQNFTFLSQHLGHMDEGRYQPSHVLDGVLSAQETVFI